MTYSVDVIEWELWGPGALVDPNDYFVAARLVDTQFCEDCRRPDLVVTMNVVTLDSLPVSLRQLAGSANVVLK